MQVESYSDNSNNIKVIYTTVNDKKQASNLAKFALEAKIVACVNIISKITSFYRYEGEIKKDKEYIMIFKSTVDNQSKIIDWLKNNHPYQTPCIIAFNAETTNEFGNFIKEQVI